MSATKKNQEYYIQWISVIKAVLISALGALAFVIFYGYQNDKIDNYLMIMDVILSLSIIGMFLVLKKYISKVGDFNND